MAIAFVASVNLAPSGNDGGTSSPITTTGANLLIVSFGNAFVSSPTFADNKGNTWIQLTLHSAGSGRHRLFYCLSPIVGTGHTFTIGGTDIYGAAIVYAFSGVGSYQTQSGTAISTNSPPVASGSMTPSMNGALVFTGLGANDAATDSITTGGFTLTTIPNAANVSLQQSAGYLIQTTAAAINPTWTWTGGTHAFTAVSSAVFLPDFPSAGVRVTQDALEVLTDPVEPPVQVTQDAIEVLGTVVAMTAPQTIRTTQTLVELVSVEIVGVHVTQDALEVLTAKFGRWKLYIAGVEKTPRVDSLSITWALNERTRATAVLSDEIPDRFAEIMSTTKNGITPMFGGLILSRAFAGRNQYDPDFQVTLECGDFFASTDWVSATLTYAADVTLKQVLQDLVDNYLAQYGIELDPFQSDGPTLAPFSWASKRVSDALRELTDRTKYVATMSPIKRLRMIFPGTIAAPFAITEGAPHVQELSWRDHDQGAGAIPPNTVKVIAGPTGAHDRGHERHYGDGVTRVWELDALFITEIGALHVYSEMAGGYPLATYGVDFWPDGQDYPWSQDPVTNTIRQRADQPVLAADDYWWLDGYIASYPMTVTAACPEMDDSPAPPVIEHVEIRTDVMSRPVAQEIADALIAQLGGCASGDGPPQVITFTTDEDGIEVGQAITVDLPTTRSIVGEFVITSVAMSIVLDPDDDTPPYWLYTVEAQDSDLYQGSYLTDWRKLTGTGGSASAGAGGGVSSGGGGAAMQSAMYLGGSRGVSVSATPAAWLPVVNFVTFTAPVSFLARVRVELFALNPGITAQARLYNLTDAASVASSSVVTSITAVSVSFGADVVLGKSYRLEVIAGTAAEGVFAIGTIEAA